MTKTQRYHGLDFARAILMIIGIFYHTALIYTPSSTWDIKHLDGSLFFYYMTSFTSSFRMQAFYVISGFFLLLIFHKKGLYLGIKDRFIRLFFPMIFIGFTFNFLANYLSQTYTFPASLEHYIFKGEWLRHTWFIGNLLGYCFLGLLLVKTNFIRALEKSLSSSKFFIILMLLFSPIIVAFIKDQAWRITGFSSYFFITPRTFLIYLPYFILGLLTYRFRTFLFDFISYINAMILIGVAIVFNLVAQITTNEMNLYSEILAEYSSFSLSFAIIVLLCRLGQTGHTLSTRLANASYTIYLLHTPLILLFYTLFFKGSHFNIFIQYAIICIIVLFSSFYIHERIINKNKILAFLFNGKVTS